MAETRVLPEDKPESPAGREPLINAITTSCPSRIRLAEVLLVFGEGTRSRAGSMQRTLPGVTRYFENPGTRIVPVGILGTEHCSRSVKIPSGPSGSRRTSASRSRRTRCAPARRTTGA